MLLRLAFSTLFGDRLVRPLVEFIDVPHTGFVFKNVLFDQTFFIAHDFNLASV